MSWHYILLTVFLFSELQEDGSFIQDDIDERFYGQVIGENIRRKCLKHGDNSTLEQYEEGERTFENCLSAIQTPRTEDELFRLICSQFPTCLKSFMKKVELCLGAEEKYLPNLFFSIGEHCKDDGKAFKDQMKGSEFVKCGSPAPYLILAVTQTCIPKLKFMHHKSELDFMVPVVDACSDVKTLQDCIVDLAPKACGNDSTKYATVFLEPALQWCEDYMIINEVK